MSEVNSERFFVAVLFWVTITFIYQHSSETGWAQLKGLLPNPNLKFTPKFLARTLFVESRPCEAEVGDLTVIVGVEDLLVQEARVLAVLVDVWVCLLDEGEILWCLIFLLRTASFSPVGDATGAH